MDLLRTKGETNLGEYFLKRVRAKEEALVKNQMQNLMIPPSLMGQDMGYRNQNSYQYSNGGQGFMGQQPLSGANSQGGFQQQQSQANADALMK